MNKGSIIAREGDVVPIGRSVVDEGRIGAANGTATLAAATRTTRSAASSMFKRTWVGA